MTEKQPNANDEPMPEGVENLHPVVFFLANNLYEINEQGNQFMPFNEEVLLEVDGYLTELSDNKESHEELMQMVQSLAAFSVGNKDNSPLMTEQIRLLIAQEYIVKVVNEWKVSADPEHVEQIAQQFGDFAGLSSTKTAPGIHDEKPDGAVSINDLNFPKRM